ncbi:anthrone oxygenase family protein [Hyunsoonleella pacifica]|uniref:DUF1772 domain-containing protein n=1 Tax=Hyunsoonleella pacifica TaxID=1080224 RepID=A0A4Q9FJP6_9FLAO|nr:anthrone oxygenase family protein [Hyunsoonleella pacifica]TBN13161.1 DUF1772 domain-containing protein [Hyunsoonleella pacifica]GGD28702.1 hypothetical protein GCM10011368_33340 [Hyunsoonleella pacifica]
MEIKFKLIVLVLGVLFTGLTAGLCFTWSNAITPGIGRLDDLSFLKSFQAMNRAIINPRFLIVFFAPVVLLFLNTYLYRKADATTFWLFLSAAVLFFIGVGLITVLKNVPLNTILENSVLEDLSSVDVKRLRETFESSWNFWHMIRTITSFTAFTLLLVGILYNK